MQRNMLLNLNYPFLRVQYTRLYVPIVVR